MRTLFLNGLLFALLTCTIFAYQFEVTFETTSDDPGDAIWSIEVLGGLWDLYTYLETTEGDDEEITVPRTYSGTGKGYNWVGSVPTTGEGVFWAEMNAAVYKIEVYNDGVGYRSFYLDMRSPDLNCLSSGQNGDFTIIYDFDDDLVFGLEGSSEDLIEIEYGDLITIWDIKEASSTDQSDLESLNSFDLQFKWHHTGKPYIWFNKRESGDHEVWRKQGPRGTYSKVQDSSTKFYFLDHDIRVGYTDYYYKVVTTNYSSGDLQVYGSISKPIPFSGDDNTEPKKVSAYPNPFNPITNIEYNVLKDGQVNVSIFNVNGKLVETITNQVLSKGSYNNRWNASGLESGIYFCIIQTEGKTFRQKLLLLK